MMFCYFTLTFIVLLIFTLVNNVDSLKNNRRTIFHSWNMPNEIHGVRNLYANVGYPPFKPCKQESLESIANNIVTDGKGILACDESTGTIGQRLESIGLRNTEENRAEWRELLFTTPNLNKYISGAILYEETLFQNSKSGKPFVDVLHDAGIIPGIKVDLGLKPLIGGCDREKWCTGLDGLVDRAQSYYNAGARFAKWRTALQIDTKKQMPSKLAIDTAVDGLAKYARICQDVGLVPIVEPEILLDGDHDIQTTSKIQCSIISQTYAACVAHGVHLPGSLLKPSMTVPGIGCSNQSNPKEIAEYTVKTLEDSVPVSVPGITFLSGGISEEDASIYLNEINSINRKGPWKLTFSFSRAIQSSCLQIWQGKASNIDSAQKQLVERAKANSEASTGTYNGNAPSLQKALFVAGYEY